MTHMRMKHVSPDQLTGNDRLEWWERRPWEILSAGHLQTSIGQSLHLPETTLPEHRPISYLLIAPAKILTSSVRNVWEITSVQILLMHWTDCHYSLMNDLATYGLMALKLGISNSSSEQYKPMGYLSAFKSNL